MIVIHTLSKADITENIEKDILECAMVFQDWRKRLLFLKSDIDTSSQMIEPSWDAQSFAKYQELQNFAVSAQEWNLNSIIALKDSQEWGLLFVPTDYINLISSLSLYLENRTSHDSFCAARHAIIDFISNKFIDITSNYLHIKNDQMNCLTYILAYLSDNRDSEIELSYIVHTLIYDYVFLKLDRKIHESKNDYFSSNSGILELSYCIKLSSNDSHGSYPPIYLPAYNISEPIPFRSSAYLKHLVYKFICKLERNEDPSTVRKDPLDLLNEHDTIVKSSIKYCTNNSHKVVDLIAKIPVIHPDGVIGTDFIPAAYCFGCNEYYILTDDFKHLRGIPICRVYSTTSIERAYFSTQKFLNYQYQSIVFAFGYNVNASNNLSIRQRRTILLGIISREILSRVEVISHLKFLIEINKNKPAFHSAIQKWVKDKQYIEGLINEEPVFTVNEIHILN